MILFSHLYDQELVNGNENIFVLLRTLLQEKIKIRSFQALEIFSFTFLDAFETFT